FDALIQSLTKHRRWIFLQVFSQARITWLDLKCLRVGEWCVHEVAFAPQLTSICPSTITRPSMRQQKLTLLAPSVLAERQIVNSCSGFNGCRNLTAWIAVS